MLCIAGLVREEIVQQAPLADPIDGLIQSPALLVIRLHGAFVILRRLRVRAQLCEGIGHGDEGFLDCRVQQVAIAQLQPGVQGPLEIPELRVGVAGPQQRLVRVRAVQAHPLERHPCLGRIARLQIGIPQCQIRSIFERPHLVAFAGQTAHRAEERVRIVQPVLAHQRHAQIEFGVGSPVLRAVPIGQQTDRLVELPVVHEHVGKQVGLLSLELR